MENRIFTYLDSYGNKIEEGDMILLSNNIETLMIIESIHLDGTKALSLNKDSEAEFRMIGEIELRNLGKDKAPTLDAPRYIMLLSQKAFDVRYEMQNEGIDDGEEIIFAPQEFEVKFKKVA